MSVTFPASVPFYKMQGSGNDFVVIDNRAARIPELEMQRFAVAACRRAFGIGADGIFFLDLPKERTDVDVIWHFFNADGSRAEMCGNASRCAARLAHMLGMAGPGLAIGTDAGVVRAEVFEDVREVRVQLTPPCGLETGIALDLGGGEAFTVHFVNTGVPHAVIFVENVENVDVDRLGRAIRYHARFAPAGTNVNFAQIVSAEAISLRTYERGVEGETYACGTGASAAVYLAHHLKLTGPDVQVTTSGGERLGIGVAEGALFLRGKAEITFSGVLNLQSVGLA